MIKNAYIHIPFCKRKCSYCSFVSGKDIKYKEQYIKTLIYEIYKKYNNEELETIYFGGGTPSLLETEDIKNILNILKYNCSTEITLEANPETVTETKFKQLKEIGINRISLGVQTFNNNILNIIGRKHTESDIYESIKTIKEAGFNNISIDLIYGLPGQTINMFKNDIDKAISLDIQHLSTYGLKIEEGSKFYKNMPENIPSNDIQAEMYTELCQTLKKNGFNHYEISNFAKPNFNSRHNCAYWLNKEYYGFGLNASGYEKNIRYTNTGSLDEYIQNPLKKSEETKLTEQETMENEIFLALRLSTGLNIKEFNKKYHTDFLKKYEKIIVKYNKLLIVNSDNIKLTEDGFLLSNEIMSEFID
ncbi:radical SAM family heme chaperone HemW [bacterium]|nr:radical SAM family heme chaperone HemW [bacterium]